MKINFVRHRWKIAFGLSDISLSSVVITALFLFLPGCGRQQQPYVIKSEINAGDTTYLKSLYGTGIYADGWVGDVAKVTLGNPRHSRAFSISGVNVETGMKDERLHLKIEFPSGNADSIDFGQTGPFTAILPMPSTDAATDTAEFRLVSSKSFVPSKLGTSKDDRSLSFRFKKIAVVDMDTAERFLPTAFEFPRKTETEPYLLGIYKDGWMADSATITLFNLNGKTSIEIRGFAPPDVFTQIASLEVRVRGALLVKEQVPKQNQGYFRFIIQLPTDVSASTRITIGLRPSGTFIPVQRGINADTRRISYQLQYVGLR
jgi:hypothetical protein